jgi:hypothetical protein
MAEGVVKAAGISSRRDRYGCRETGVVQVTSGAGRGVELVGYRMGQSGTVPWGIRMGCPGVTG